MGLNPPPELLELEGVPTDVAFLQTPDGHGQLELIKFHTPAYQGEHRDGQANAPGIRHLAFTVKDIDAVVAGLRARGTELVGQLERYEDSYLICYVRGPEGIIVELAEQIGNGSNPWPRRRRLSRLQYLRPSPATFSCAMAFIGARHR